MFPILGSERQKAITYLPMSAKIALGEARQSLDDLGFEPFIELVGATAD